MSAAGQKSVSWSIERRYAHAIWHKSEILANRYTISRHLVLRSILTRDRYNPRIFQFPQVLGPIIDNVVFRAISKAKRQSRYLTFPI